MNIKNLKINYKLIFICFVISLLIEVILFNITSYRVLLGNYEKETYELTPLCNPDDSISIFDGKVFLTTDKIDKKVVSLKLDFDQENNDFKTFDITINYVDDTNLSSDDQFLYLGTKRIDINNDNTKYINTYFSGNLYKTGIYVSEDVYASFSSLPKVTINEMIKINFSIIRFLVVYIITLFSFLIKKSKVFKEEYSYKSFKQEFILFSVLSLFILIIVLINMNCCEEIDDPNAGWLSDISTQTGIYNKDFIDSLRNGKLYLEDTIPDNFDELEDPYNPLERESTFSRDSDYIWDTAYYNGKNYIYFGIVPALLIFLPYNLLTGFYLKASSFVMIFSLLCLFLMKEILTKIFKLFFKNIKFLDVFLFLIIIYSGSMLLFINNSARIYEVAIISALYLVLQGYNLFLSAYEENDNKIKIFLGSLCLALSVGCRPTMLIASVVAIPYFIYLLIKYVKNKDVEIKNIIKLFVSVVIPYFTIGILLMIYNYVRFDSILEFGSKYQLTICNINKLKNGLYAIFVGLITNLFMFPKFMLNYPYIQHINSTINNYGYYYIEDMIGGLFMICPICFMVFSLFNFNKKVNNNHLKVMVNTLVITASIIMIISIYMAGSCQRYLLDYAFMFILASILISAFYIENLKSEETKLLVDKILLIVSIFTLILSVLMGIVGEKGHMEDFHIEKYIQLEENIEFWK